MRNKATNDIHTEASFLAFTGIVTPGGIKWNATIRDGADAASFVAFAKMLNEVGHELTGEGFTFTERQRVRSDDQAKHKIAMEMKGRGWPISDRTFFLPKLMEFAAETLNLTPDNMRSEFDLWMRFVQTFDIFDIMEEVAIERARAEREAEEDERRHGTEISPEVIIEGIGDTNLSDEERIAFAEMAEAQGWIAFEDMDHWTTTPVYHALVGDAFTELDDEHAGVSEEIEAMLVDRDLMHTDAPPPQTDITTGEHD